MNDKDHNKTLYIPSNIESDKQIFDGIGLSEILFIILCFFVCFTIVLILKLTINLDGIYMGLALLITMGGSYMIAKKDGNNMSMLKMLISLIRFLNAQRNYKYVYKGGWLNDDDGTIQK